MSEAYTKEIRNKLKYSATWLPNVKVRLGDVVVLSDHTYRRIGGADEFGINFLTRESEGDALLNHMSTDKVKIHFFGSGSGPEALKDHLDTRAGLEVEFTDANAILFQTGPCKILEIENLISVGDQVMELYQNGKWKENHVLITELVHSEYTTVLISSAANARVVFTAKVGAKLGPTSFVDVNAGLKILESNNIGTKIVSESDMTPLFRGFAIRKPLLRQARFGPIRKRHLFAEVDYDDFT